MKNSKKKKEKKANRHKKKKSIGEKKVRKNPIFEEWGNAKYKCWNFDLIEAIEEKMKFHPLVSSKQIRTRNKRKKPTMRHIGTERIVESRHLFPNKKDGIRNR